MLRTRLFMLLVVALAGCSAATTTATPTQSQATVLPTDTVSLAPTVGPTVETTPEPVAAARAAVEFIVTAADVPSTFGSLTGLSLSAPINPSEISQESLADWEEPDAVTKLLAEGFTDGYSAAFNLGESGADLSSSAYVFDNPAGALAYQADAVAALVAAGCTPANTVATIGDASGAVSCPTFGGGLVSPKALIIFVIDNAVATISIKAIGGEAKPNMELLAEIARTMEARLAG